MFCSDIIPSTDVITALSKNGVTYFEKLVKVKLYPDASVLAPPVVIFDAVTLAPSKDPINW